MKKSILYILPLLTLMLQSCSPTEAEKYYFKAEEKFKKKQYKEVIVLFNKSLKLNPVNSFAYNDRSVCYFYLDNLKKSMNDVNKAIEIDPEYYIAYSNRARLNHEDGKYKVALKDCNISIKLYSEYPQAYTNRGKAKFELKNRNGALRDLNKAINLGTEDSEAYNYRGLVKGKTKSVLADFDKAIELTPDYEVYYFNRGVYRTDMNDLQGAMEDFNKALELDSNCSRAYAGRATLWFLSE